ncbi:Z-ring associated ZapG family protein [Neobacillus ginsengisoli]|uniref:Uncharacterized protein n=1 Tax=Neobacillus ginsengisoli TaxID=904295 RepID=A0ABT9XR68_9BACI|nr:hypothetical protein [Neobacillus ginsengisoli]MDQ0197893.1 hypothetical protein [Neobacillus ginsengisoli]
MYVVATFHHSKNIEMAIADIENIGLENNKILVLPLDKQNDQTKIFDTIYDSNGQSYVDVAAILGMVFMLLGAIYGFVLNWGPVLWALIGLVFGIILGFLIRFFYNKSKKHENMAVDSRSEIVVIFHCEEYQEEKVTDILWGHVALGVATYKNS